MSNKIELKPQNIIGDVTLDTPFFIIEYILHVMNSEINNNYIGVDSYYQNAIDEINNHNFHEIILDDKNLEDSDLRKIRCFISPVKTKVQWYNDALLDGLNHLNHYNIKNKEFPPLNKNKILFGAKTSISPFSLNELIVYAICKRNGYKCERYTTYHELCFYIQKLNEKNEKNLKNSLLHNINSMNNNDIIKLYYNISNETKINDISDTFIISNKKENKFKFDENLFEMTTESFINKLKYLAKIKPSSNYEAIIIALNVYNIDITESSHPIRELENLSKRKYIPYCPNFSMKYNINPDIYNTNKTWCKNLSSIYKREQLLNFVEEEGVEESNGMTTRDINSYLKSSHSIFNFYFGRHPDCNETSTIIYMEPINDILDEELICCGNLKTKKLLYTTFSELYEYFNSEKMYIDLTKERNPIDEIAIKKLKRQCKLMMINSDKKIYEDLLKLFEDLDIAKNLIDLNVRQLKDLLIDADPEVKNNVDLFFRKCMEMGLYMRGWTINDNKIFPLKSESTVIYEGDVGLNNIKIHENTIISYEESKDILNLLPVLISNKIKTLHTLRFSKSNKGYKLFNMIFKGTRVYYDETLVDCMGKIYCGISNDDGCIRKLSGWILYTSCWYRFLFGFDVPFSMDEIDDIQ